MKVPEIREHRLKRLRMRSMRRGIKEMDLILPPYAAARLEGMNEADLTLYEALLNENDHDLYQWVTGQVSAPDPYANMVADIQSQLKAHRV